MKKTPDETKADLEATNNAQKRTLQDEIDALQLYKSDLRNPRLWAGDSGLLAIIERISACAPQEVCAGQGEKAAIEAGRAVYDFTFSDGDTLGTLIHESDYINAGQPLDAQLRDVRLICNQIAQAALLQQQPDAQGVEYDHGTIEKNIRLIEAYLPHLYHMTPPKQQSIGDTANQNILSALKHIRAIVATRPQQPAQDGAPQGYKLVCEGVITNEMHDAGSAKIAELANMGASFGVQADLCFDAMLSAAPPADLKEDTSAAETSSLDSRVVI